MGLSGKAISVVVSRLHVKRLPPSCAYGAFKVGKGVWCTMLRRCGKLQGGSRNGCIGLARNRPVSTEKGPIRTASLAPLAERVTRLVGSLGVRMRPPNCSLAQKKKHQRGTVCRAWPSKVITTPRLWPKQQIRATDFAQTSTKEVLSCVCFPVVPSPDTNRCQCDASLNDEIRPRRLSRIHAQRMYHLPACTTS